MTIKIGTHSGEFHADDVLACAALTMLNGKIEVVRTRDAAVLATCDILVDVGGVYDVATLRFDHHQREGAPEPRANGVRFSSFGLVWNLFGAEIAGGVAQSKIVDRDLVQAIDALDNGQGTCDVLSGVKHATVSGMIANLNPTWQELASGASYDTAFHDAVAEGTKIIIRAVAAARAEVAMLDSFRIVTPEILITDLQGISASDAVKALADVDCDAAFLVHLAGNGEWSAQAVPPSRSREFEQRVPFPSAWGWKRGAELAAVSGVPDAIFSHGGGFFACAKSREGAIALCKNALAK